MKKKNKTVAFTLYFSLDYADYLDEIILDIYDLAMAYTGHGTDGYLEAIDASGDDRIEELAEKAKQDVQKSIHEAGINCAFKLGLPRINKELLDYID